MVLVLHLFISGACGQTPAETPKPPTSSIGSQTVSPNPSAQPDPQLAAAKLLVEQGKIADADRATRDYVQLHPGSGDAHFLRGYILFREIQLRAAANQDSPERYRDPDMKMPDSDVQEEAAKDSLAEFTEGAKYRKPTAFDLKIVALDYILLADYVDADKWLTRSLQWNPKDADAWYQIGRIKYSENRFDEAAQSFQQYLKFEPKSVKAEDNLGLSYAGLGETDKAIAAYQSAIAWQSASLIKDPGPFLDLGILLMEQNRTQEAIPYLLQAIAIAPKESRHHEELGQAYSRLEDLQKAQEEFEAAVSLSPQNPRLHYLLARVYRKEGLTAKADAEFNRSESLKQAQAPPSLAKP